MINRILGYGGSLSGVALSLAMLHDRTGSGATLGHICLLVSVSVLSMWLGYDLATWAHRGRS